MKKFFDDRLLLESDCAHALYERVRALPIVDYHCHLDQGKIARDEALTDIGELWLAGDHYKWRAMRMCGVDERYVTGDASYKEKFLRYAEIMPKLIGNPLYYWSHIELKQLFGINEPLDGTSAERIYAAASSALRGMTVRKLLDFYGVEYLATTDDPCDDLAYNGVYGATTVAPTFRPDRAFALDDGYIAKLERATGSKINGAGDYLAALLDRLDYFRKKGCTISDHGFAAFPEEYITDAQAEQAFKNRDGKRLFGWLLLNLAKAYKKRGVTMQLHFSVVRNNNTEMFALCGADSGFDLIGEAQSARGVIKFLNAMTDAERPRVVLYTLNDCNLRELAAVTGAFRNVTLGAAWWFNDTVEGIKRNIMTVAEYSALGTSLGMLTDSRSFSSYGRFDFFRLILCDVVGGMAERGECDMRSAEALLLDVCYNNAKRMVKGNATE